MSLDHRWPCLTVPGVWLVSGCCLSTVFLCRPLYFWTKFLLKYPFLRSVTNSDRDLPTPKQHDTGRTKRMEIPIVDGELSIGKQWSNHKIHKICSYISRHDTFYNFYISRHDTFFVLQWEFFSWQFFLLFKKKTFVMTRDMERDMNLWHGVTCHTSSLINTLNTLESIRRFRNEKPTVRVQKKLRCETRLRKKKGGHDNETIWILMDILRKSKNGHQNN